LDAVETAIVHGELKKVEGTGFVKDTHSLKNIADKTVNLPEDPADESEVEAAIAASEAVVTGAVSTSEGVVTGAITTAHGTTDGKVDAVKAVVDTLPTLSDVEASTVLALESDVESAITSAHGTTDGKVDAVQSDIDLLELGVANVLVDTAAIKAQTDLIPAVPASQGDVTTAHTTTDGKVDDVQSDVTAIKASTDNLPADPASEASVEGAVSAAHGVTDGKVDDVQSAVEALPTLAEIEASAALAKEASVGALPSLAEIEASAVLAKEASVGALPTLVEIEASAVLAKDATVAKDSTVAKEATLTHATYGLDKIKTETAAIKAKTDLIPDELVGLLMAAGGGPYALSDDVLFADDPLVSKDSADYVKVKEINVGYLSGTLRVAFDSRDPSGASHWVHATVYKNGVALGTERSQNGDWYTYSEELEFAKNDLLQLYVKNSDAGFPIEVRNFRILGKYPVPGVPAVVVVS